MSEGIKTDSLINLDDDQDYREQQSFRMRDIEAKERIADALEKIVELAEAVK